MNVEKYKNVLELFNPKNVEHKELAEIIERSVSLIKYKHQKLDVQYQIAGVFIIVQLYLECPTFNATQIEEILERFYKYYDDDYVKYIESLELITDRVHTDLCFYYDFIKTESES